MAPSLPFQVVDVHNHVISKDTVRFPAAPMGGTPSQWSQERPVDEDGMLAAMDDAGVAQSVLVQASTCYGNDNSYVIASVKNHPRAFAGVFSADFSAPDATKFMADHMAAGMSGVRVFVAGHTAANANVRLDDPLADPAWAWLEENKVPVSVQLRADKLDQLEAVLARHPDAVVIVDHCARPVLEDGPPYAAARPMFALARHKNLYLKYTTHNVRESRLGQSTAEAFAKALVEQFGAHRVAWGSNFPASAGGLAAHLQEALEATAALTEQDRAWIFSGTSRSLYPLLEA